MRKDRYIPSIQGRDATSGVTSHTQLTDKEDANGIIDHADNSITTAKIRDAAVTDQKLASGISWSKISKVGSSINDLDDVNATPINGQVLTWNSTLGIWEARSINAIVSNLPYINLNDEGFLLDGSDETTKLNNLLALNPNAQCVRWKGKLGLVNFQFNRNNLKFWGYGGLDYQGGEPVSEIVQVDPNKPAIAFKRPSAQASLYGVEIKDIGLVAADASTKPIIDGSDFKRNATDGNNTAMYRCKLENLGVKGQSSSTALAYIDLYNWDSECIVRNIQCMNMKTVLVRHKADGHNSLAGCIFQSIHGFAPANGARALVIEAGHDASYYGNSARFTIDNIRVFNSDSSSLTDVYALEMITHVSARVLRFFHITNIHNEASRLFKKSGSGKIDSWSLRGFSYQDKRSIIASADKVGIEISGACVRGHISDGYIGNSLIGNNIGTGIDLSGIGSGDIFVDVSTIEWEGVNTKVVLPSGDPMIAKLGRQVILPFFSGWFSNKTSTHYLPITGTPATDRTNEAVIQQIIGRRLALRKLIIKPDANNCSVAVPINVRINAVNKLGVSLPASNTSEQSATATSLREATESDKYSISVEFDPTNSGSLRFSGILVCEEV